MSELNDMNNDYFRHFTNIHQSSYPEDFNFDDANTPIHQSNPQDFSLSVASFSLSDNVDVMPIIMDSMDYEDTGDYTGDYASYQGNPSDSHFHSGDVDAVNGHMNSPNPDQAETYANSSCPLPVSFQTVYGSSNLNSDTINDGFTDNHFSMINNSSTSYIFTHDPTGTGYVVTKVEHTQLVLGRMSAADFNQMLSTI